MKYELLFFRYPEAFQNALNTGLLQSLPGAENLKSVSLRTATRWMHLLGFHPHKHKKGYFVEGHERPDVITHRKVFLQYMETVERRMKDYGGKERDTIIEPKLQEGERECVLITHDEMICYANDGTQVIWIEEGEIDLRPKTNGSSLMVSGFTCPCHGWLTLNGKTSWKIIRPSSDGNWLNTDLVEQLHEVIPLFKELHPECDLVFAFDNSSNHLGRAPDELNVNHMNLSDGGKNKLPRRNTKFQVEIQGGHKEWRDQLMSVGFDAEGEPIAKGIKSTLQERGLWRNDLKLQCAKYTVDECEGKGLNCCARRILSEQPDFKKAKNSCWIREIVESYGCFLTFYPKFHCELNYIELIWAFVKKWLRRHCSYTLESLQEQLPIALNTVPLSVFRKSWQHCSRFMSGYRLGFIGPILDYAVKKYKSHRRVPNCLQLRLIEEYQMHVSKNAKRKFGENSNKYTILPIMSHISEMMPLFEPINEAVMKKDDGVLMSLMHLPNPTCKRKRGISDDECVQSTKKKKVAIVKKNEAKIMKANKLAAAIKKGEEKLSKPGEVSLIAAAASATTRSNHQNQESESTMTTWTKETTTTTAATVYKSDHSLLPFMSILQDSCAAILHTTSTGGTGTFRYIGQFGEHTYTDPDNSNVDIRLFKNRPLTESMEAIYDKTIADDRNGDTIMTSFKGYNVKIVDLKRLRQPKKGVRHRQLWLDDSVSLTNACIFQICIFTIFLIFDLLPLMHRCCIHINS